MRQYIKHTAAYLLLFFYGVTANAAWLKGKVTDDKGIGIPYALIFAEGTEFGTTANAAGEYLLQLGDATYWIQCQSIGYVSERIQVAAGSDRQHNFQLKAQGLDIKEVTVRAGEDPALRIIKKAIKKRKHHLQQVKSFRSDVYIKGVLRTSDAPAKLLGQDVKPEDLGLDSMGKGILYLLEEQATYYSRPDGKNKTFVHSVRESGNPQGTGLSRIPKVISFYENNVHLFSELNPRGFISPLNDLSLNYYHFRLAGTFLLNNQTIYKITLTPRRKYEPCFKGEIFIADDDWAVQALDLTVDKEANLNMLDTLKVRQQFIKTGKDQWIIKQQLLYPDIRIFGFGFNGYLLSLYSNQQVNPSLPDSLFEKNLISEYADDALQRDSVFWQNRPVQLEEDEQKDYRIKDSMHTVMNDPVRLDSLRKIANKLSLTELLLRGYTYRTEQDKIRLTFEPLINIVQYNTVEGLNISPGGDWNRQIDSQTSLKGTHILRYGFSNQHLNNLNRISWQRTKKDFPARYYKLEILGGKYVYQYSGFNQVPYLFNTYSTLMDGINHLKIYERSEVQLSGLRNWGNGWRINGSVAYQRRTPLHNTSNYSWSSETQFTSNTPSSLWAYPWHVHNAFLVELGIRYRPGVRYVRYPNLLSTSFGNWPVFHLNYQKGIPNILNSKVDYDKWEAGVDGDFTMRMFGQLNYQVLGGGFLRDKWVSLPDLKHFHGNEYRLMGEDKNAFALMPYYRFSHALPLYTEVHIDWQLQGLLTNKIPLFKKLQWYLVVGSNNFYAQKDFWYAEAYVGLDNIGWKLFRLLRVDAVWGRDGYDQQYQGIRIRLKTGALGLGN